MQQSQQFLFFFASFLTIFEPVSEKRPAMQKHVNERTAPFQSSKLCLVRNMLRLQKCKLPESVSFVDWFCCASYQEHGWTTVAMPRESSGSQAWRRTNDYSIYPRASTPLRRARIHHFGQPNIIVWSTRNIGGSQSWYKHQSITTLNLTFRSNSDVLTSFQFC